VNASAAYQRSFFEMHIPWRGEYDAIADALANRLSFSSVLDLGCGNGFLIARLGRLGKSVSGVDGSVHVLECVPTELIPKIRILDLTTSVRLGRFDLVICSEVAEHLDAQYADTLVDSVCENSAGLVFFTAALVGQGGLYHLNEQPHDYWIAMFHRRQFGLDYQMTQILREDLSQVVRTMWWFTRNALIFRGPGLGRVCLNASMRAQAIIITCPERAQMLDNTVSRLCSTDWDGSAYIQMDRCGTNDPRARQTENTRNGLKWFLKEGEADFALVLEDDLEFNRHLRCNLERWSPILDDRLHFGSLYNPNVRSICQADDYFLADPAACYGSQAYLLSRNAILVLLRDWDQVVGMQDIKVTRILAAAGYSLYYHKPSLVQHVGRESVWGGGFHWAPDFDGEWISRFSYERIPGWFTFPKLYEQAVDEAKDGDVLVEVGVWLGRSTAFLCEKAKASGKRLKVLIVDAFKIIPEGLHMVPAAIALHGSVRSIFERNMRMADASDYLEIHATDPVEAAAAVPDRSCAFVFIDADPRYEAVRANIRAWIGKVRRGAVLAGHDCYTYATVYNAVRDELDGNFSTTDENVWIYRAP
jgi:Methyltransferase domain